jgi:hypothetical protein
MGLNFSVLPNIKAVGQKRGSNRVGGMELLQTAEDVEEAGLL